MKRRYYRKPIKVTGFQTKGHIFVGIVWPIKGSTGNTYNVEMHEDGFSCDCTGFTMHGKCKHITQVHKRITDENYPKYR